MQTFISEVIPIIQLWARENKTAIDHSDQKLKHTLGKPLIEQQQLLNRVCNCLSQWAYTGGICLIILYFQRQEIATIGQYRLSLI